MTTQIDLTADIINVGDITDRLDELASLDAMSDEEASEHADLSQILDQLRGYGGDHKWDGHWYPGYLIADSYFRTYAQELAEDIGAIPDDTKWPCTCIDWDQATRELQMDYSTVEIDGATYWYR